MRVAIPQKQGNCNTCVKDVLYDRCDGLVNQSKEFSANLNELKREPPFEFGHRFPKYQAV